MKQITLNSLLLSALLALGLVACDSKSDLEPGSLTGDTAAVLNLVKGDGKMGQASPYKITSFVISDPEITSQDVTMNVQLFRPAEETRKVTLAVDKEAADRYQHLQGQAYKLLDPSMITLPEQVVVKKGATYSDNFTIKVSVPETLEPNTKYLFAIALTDVECSKVIRPIHSTALFTVERFVESDDILKSVRLTRDLYFTLAQPFGNKGDEAMTLETLINVEKFRTPEDPGEASISTLMGVEGGTLMRFGDSGVPGNQLQANGTRVDFTFETGKWYHIAMTCSDGITKVYINGDLKTTFPKGGSLSGGDPFLIGRSYSGGRGIQARLSETRVWSVARSAEEIKDNMYKVDAKSDGLLAYWHMITADGSVVSDATGNNYDLLQKGQAAKSGDQPVEIYEESSPITIE